MKLSVRPIDIGMKYGWRVAGVLAASVALTALALVYAEFDLATLLCAAMTLITGVLLSIFAVASTGRRRWVALSVLAVYMLGSAFLLTHVSVSRSHLRWFLLSRSYEARVLGAPTPGNGELRHALWDGSGFGGQDTLTYLVFDPTNSLRVTLGTSAPVRASGLPCRVLQVTRLESQWYAVKFYTDETWIHGECT